MMFEYQELVNLKRVVLVDRQCYEVQVIVAYSGDILSTTGMVLELPIMRFESTMRVESKNHAINESWSQLDWCVRSIQSDLLEYSLQARGVI